MRNVYNLPHWSLTTHPETIRILSMDQEKKGILDRLLDKAKQKEENFQGANSISAAVEKTTDPEKRKAIARSMEKAFGK